MHNFLKKRLIGLLSFVIIALIIALLNLLYGPYYFTLAINFFAQINPIINILALGGVILLWIQIKAEHERSRREKAVDLLFKWNDSLKKETAVARRIVEEFTPDQCRCLYKEELFEVNAKHYKDIIEIAKDDSCTFKKHETSAHQYIKLSSAQVSKLRWLTISYLNMLESILVAWQYSVADRGIIEAQFSYLFDSSNCFATLTNFRMACGGDSSYPAIEVFAANVKKDKEKCLIEKGNVI